MSIRVALFGTKFMGKAHSQAWRNVNMFFADAPRVEMKVIVGRNPAETAQAAANYGWQEASTDWKAVMARDETGPKVGEAPPDFSLKRLGSQERVSLSSFKGRQAVALAFGSYT